jgi:hypothetical protein
VLLRVKLIIIKFETHKNRPPPTKKILFFLSLSCRRVIGCDYLITHNKEVFKMMNIATQLSEFVKGTKGFKFQFACENEETNQYALIIFPIKTESGSNDERVKTLEHTLNQPVRIAGTPDQIDMALGDNLESLKDARSVASSNLNDLLKELKVKPKAAPKENKGNTTPRAKGNPAKTPSKEDAGLLAAAMADTTQPTERKVETARSDAQSPVAETSSTAAAKPVSEQVDATPEPEQVAPKQEPEPVAEVEEEPHQAEISFF